MNDAIQQVPEEVYATLSGNVDQQMVGRVFANFSTAVNIGVKKVHLLIQSTGGFVGDGVALYNYLRNLPIDLTTYNSGHVASIAVMVYLAGKTRKASSTATFMIHRTYTGTSLGMKSENLILTADSLRKDDARTEAILKENINLPAGKWRIHKHNDLVLSALEAKSFNLCHEISDFKVPPGNKISNI